MAEVLRLPSPPSSGSSPTPPSPLSCAPPTTESGSVADDAEESVGERDRGNGDQLSFLALLFTIFRKSLVVCRSDRRRLCAMEIGWPSDVRHVAHVTFDRFNGFLGLPVEFEPEVPRRAPSASAHVFGVSTESMQLAYDSRGNSVPTILLLMQRRLYDGGGLQAEGIFRINADNGQEEYVRDQLNRGIVPEGIDVHCLAGLIKAWFRELPTGILDSVPPDQIIQCSTEEDCMELVRALPTTEASLLDWAINLMADVAQMERFNKMNARNIAMVFAPNMTQMADPFTALMYAVQVMNFLKTLVARTLRLREDSVMEPESPSTPGPFDENGHESPSKLYIEDDVQDNEDAAGVPFFSEEPNIESSICSDESTVISQLYYCNSIAPPESLFSDVLDGTEARKVDGPTAGIEVNEEKSKLTELSFDGSPQRMKAHQLVSEITAKQMEITGAISSLSRIESRMARIEAWR